MTSVLTHAYGMLSLLMLGQATLPALSGNWMDVYRQALRSELVEGDLQAAIAGYRRVAASDAPPVYGQHASYRWAHALRQLGRDDEAAMLLNNLAHELAENSPLKVSVLGQLAELQMGAGNRLAYWQAELKASGATGDLARLREAAQYLARSDGDEGIRSLCDFYATAGVSHPGRTILIKAMGESNWPDAVPLLRSALSDSSTQVVSAAAEALGLIADAESTSRLVELLAAADVDLRRSAVTALHRLGATEAVDELVEALKTAQDAGLRKDINSALQAIGTATALDVASSMPAEADEEAGGAEHTCSFSEWYRGAIHADTMAQQHLSPRLEEEPQGRVPRIGMVVSAMTHHGPACRRQVHSYTAQLRKAWALQRAGFEVVLLAEAEALDDTDGRALAGLLNPECQLHPLGSWPACDVILLDNLFHLSAAVVQTLAGWCERGGKLVVCGAVGGGFCGDGVTWRRLLQVRWLHAHGFTTEEGRLLTSSPDSEAAPLQGGDWAGPRRGSFFPHLPLGGQVITEHDVPPAWAIKQHSFGAGQVLCFNWDIGLSLRGTQDEDELLCRYIDTLVGVVPGSAVPASAPTATAATATAPAVKSSRRVDHPLFWLMHLVRWGRWAEAKKALTAESLQELDPSQRAEAVLQLANIYLMENNFEAGLAACGGLIADDPQREALLACADRLRRLPRRVRLSLQVGDEFPWWVDVPTWQRLPLPGGRYGFVRAAIPLWLTGPGDLQSRVRIRIWVAPNSPSILNVYLRGSEVEGGREERERQIEENGPSLRRIAVHPREIQDNWYEFRMSLQEWNAAVGIEFDINEP